MSKGSRKRPTNVSMAESDANFENIFGKRVPTYMKKLIPEDDMQVRVQENQKAFGNCGCGRSPNGKCIGWHGLTEDEFAQRKELYETGKVDLAGKDIK